MTLVLQNNWLNFPCLDRLGVFLRGRKALPCRLGSVTGSLRSLALHWLAMQGRTVLAVTRDEKECRSLAQDLRFLMPDHNVYVNPPLDYGGDIDRALEGWGALGERVTLLKTQYKKGTPCLIISSISSLLERVPSPSFIQDAGLSISVGKDLNLENWVRTLAGRGHRRVPLVEAPGEFAVRGGILDVYPVGADMPVRIELFGDEVDSIRLFEATHQRSVEQVKAISLLAVSVGDYLKARRSPDSVSLFDYLPDKGNGGVIALLDPRDLEHQAEKAFNKGTTDDLLSYKQILAEIEQRPHLSFEKWLIDPAEDERVVNFEATPPEIRTTDITELSHDIQGLLAAGDQVAILCPTTRDQDQMRSLLRDIPDLLEHPRITLDRADLGRGFRIKSEKLTILSSAEILHRMRGLRWSGVAKSKTSPHTGREITGLGDLTPGQAVVHVVHGIGLFRGVKALEQEGHLRDHLVIEYKDKALLYIPVDRIGLVRHYIGPRDGAPPLSKLGSAAWSRRKAKVQKACEDLASDLLEIHAARKVQPGYSYPPDDPEMFAFEASFPYPETDDQIAAIDAVKHDLESKTPMDRLICGDVGFGKTEVALRGVVKAALHGKQVAVLAPTTVLAHQHERTFKGRISMLPLIVEVISRFRSKREQKDILKRVKAGKVDILIGTHRILSKDVEFKDLGLLVIDEEQRFGVAHKETLKSYRRTIDVLTLTATPIPRTLHMAMAGVRDISVIASPPLGRIPIRSMVTHFDEKLIERAVSMELMRGGQVYIVHDRVSSIDKLAALIIRLVPSATVAVVHGQMDEKAMEKTMLSFVGGMIDVLVATKIIENGLDVPRANTLIVNRADRFGLAELHQIRGRVGRHTVQAYAYFLLSKRGQLTVLAEKRLRAIEDHSELGAGFRIALRDLEIRGAGNLLGAQQSGHVGDVGYDLYCRLLRKAVEDLRKRRKAGENIAKGQGLKKTPLDIPIDEVRASPRSPIKKYDESVDLELDTGAVELGFQVPASIPDTYMPDIKLKIEAYRKLAAAETIGSLDDLAEELKDRYGPIPDSVKLMFALRSLRLLAVMAGVTIIRRQDKVVILHYQDKQLLQAALYGYRLRLRFVEAQVAHLLPDDPSATDRDMIDFLLEAFSALDRKGTAQSRKRFGTQADNKKIKRRKKRGPKTKCPS
jgi:transcription-repair coupling factor (superfamily II helicase)